MKRCGSHAHTNRAKAFKLGHARVCTANNPQAIAKSPRKKLQQVTKKNRRKTFISRRPKLQLFKPES
jgi:hypothetical protein